MGIDSRDDFAKFNLHDLTCSLRNSSNGHQPCVPLSPIIASKHRRYILECRGENFFSAECTRESVECLVVDERIGVVCGVF